MPASMSAPADPPVTLRFAAGTIEVRGLARGEGGLPGCVWDERTACGRAPAVAYADLVRALVAGKRPYVDEARAYGELAGGGDHDVGPLTVATYDSAYLHMEHLGNRFGLVVFDECHHLPSGSYALAARLALAPFRLGLTATPERADGRHALYPELIGP